MSGVVNIRGALHTAISGMAALATACENDPFDAPALGPTTPYQVIHILFAKPNNQEFGSTHQELGYMQVKLMYPLEVGTGTVEARAELLRTAFPRGSSFTDSGVTVTISDTPEVMPGQAEGGRYAVIVKIRFYANIT